VIDTCFKCKCNLEVYGTNFVNIEVVRNYQSQGYPDQYVVGKIQFCLNCLDEQLKQLIQTNILK